MNGANLPGRGSKLLWYQDKKEAGASLPTCLGIRAGPGLEVAFIVFVVSVKGDVGERLIRDEFLLPGVFPRQVEVGMPGAGIEVDLVSTGVAVIQGYRLVMVRMSINNITCRVIEE